ncbi:hypothetical protein NBRC111894_1387 [Sporolactobacillus inulinus]|uniref:Uncharacterized protein n=1 Tax=Sporolactobacillus inulinus TaxID=2078 RepID=A0A4Y1ZA85_9BACL|nr:hypothetical protein NBRC111894_1387 [Sporolactobacillus inulinus]
MINLELIERLLRKIFAKPLSLCYSEYVKYYHFIWRYPYG